MGCRVKYIGCDMRGDRGSYSTWACLVSDKELAEGIPIIQALCSTRMFESSSKARQAIKQAGVYIGFWIGHTKTKDIGYVLTNTDFTQSKHRVTGEPELHCRLSIGRKHSPYGILVKRNSDEN